VAVRSYDKLSINEDILLDLPFNEGSGAITGDIAKPHHTFDLNNAPTWTSLVSGRGVLTFDGATEYLDASAASTADMDFTSGDYSVGVWINWTDVGGGLSQIVIGRYGVDLDGWEIYLTEGGGFNYLTQRHHHATLAPNTRDGCYSTGWAQSTWFLLGISRSGLYPVHYRNGVALAMSYEATGMLDPDTCNRDMVIGTRYTKDANWYQNMMWRPRMWSRVLSADEWMEIYDEESGWF